MTKIASALILFFIASNLLGQNKYFTGIVKELHHILPNKTRPLQGVSVTLKKPSGSIVDRTTTTGQFKFFTTPEDSSILELEYPGYEIVDKDELKTIQWNTDATNESAHILLSKIGAIEKIATEYYHQVNARLILLNQKKIDSIKNLYNTDLDLFKKKNQELQDNLISMQAQARAFANIFATTDFDSLSSNYYNAFLQFKLGNLDSCNYYLNDTFLENEERKLNLQKRVAAGALIMKAQINTNNSYKKTEDYYKRAIVADPRYYTYEAYSNFLLQQQKYIDVIPYLEQKLNLLNDPISTKDSIYTLFQLSKVNSRLQHTDILKAHYYDSLIISKSNFIEASSNELLQSILTMTYLSLTDYYSDLRIKTKDDNYEYKTIDALQKSIYYYIKFNLEKNDSLSIWTVDLSELYYEIGLTYEEIFSNKDSASAYYLKAVSCARDNLFKFNDERHMETLLERYDDFGWSECFNKTEKIKILKAEKLLIKNRKDIDPHIKNEILHELNSYIEDIKKNDEPSLDITKVLNRMLKG
jgi:hypothetical protein